MCVPPLTLKRILKKMTEQTFNAGDTVRLKSGGPLMTVESAFETYGAMQVHCTWFVGTKLERGSFVPGALQASQTAGVSVSVARA